MDAIARRGTVVALMLVSMACAGSVPTSPTGTPPPANVTPLPSVTPPTTFPPVSGPARSFIFDHADYRVQEYTQKSRFVLYDNGAFVLQYATVPGGQYRGSYTEEHGLITFTWQGWSAAGPWGATGRLEADALKVQYNLIMQMTDFEDAMYARTP